MIPELKIDGVIAFSDLENDKLNTPMPKLFRLIEQMAPFGPANPRPNFIIKNLVDTGNSKVVGQKHLKLQLKEKDNNKYIDAIWFNNSKMMSEIQKAESFSLVANLSANTYMGNTKLQLMVKDIKLD